jgi:hypothetical protein
MSLFPYRWLPRTILPNLKSFLNDIVYGIKNLIKWTPIIWIDRDWDWYFLAKILKYKISNMAKYERKYGHHVRAEKDAHDMEICVEYLRRILEDDPDLDPDEWKRHQSHCKEFGRILGRKMLSWWD